MPITIKPTQRKDITKLVCPACREPVRGIGVLKESQIAGLTFKCKRCASTWEVTTE
jgi:transposase-like protein